MAYNDKVMGVESGGNNFAKNPRSTAYGPHQFLSSTWLNMIRKYRPDLAQGKSIPEILALRSNRDISSEMNEAYGRENAGVLQKAGFEPTEGRKYLAHFAGAGGATKLLSNPQGSAAETLGPEVVKANPFLAGWTNQKVIDWADGKMGFQPMTVNTKAAPLTSAAPAPAPAGGLADAMNSIGAGFGTGGSAASAGETGLQGMLGKLGMGLGGSDNSGGKSGVGDANFKMATAAAQAAGGDEDGAPQLKAIQKPIDIQALSRILQQRSGLGMGSNKGLGSL